MTAKFSFLAALAAMDAAALAETVVMPVPFCGFYESALSGFIDDEIDSAIEYENTEIGANISADDFSISQAVFTDLAKKYAGFYPTWLKEHTSEIDDGAGVDIAVSFDHLDSPAYYNYRTDYLYCKVSRRDVLRCGAWLESQNREYFADYVYGVLKPRSGFIPRYDNDIDRWEDCSAWSGVQLSLVLDALQSYLERTEDVYPADLSFTEYLNESSQIAIWDYMERRAAK